MEINIGTNDALPIILFIVGWVLAVVDNGWRSPILWVTSAIAVALFLT